MKVFNLKIRSSVTLLVVTFLAFTFCVATPAHALRKHKSQYRVADEFSTPWSLQIALDEQIDDGDEDYSGIQLSLNHFLSGKQALRFTMGIGDRNNVFDEAKIYRRGEATYLFDKYTEFDVTSVSFSFQGIFYSSPYKEPRFYFGLGPRLAFSDANPLVYVSYPNEDWMAAVDYDNGSQVSFGLEGTVGFELFMGPNISMIAEFGTAFQKDWYILEFDYYDNYGHSITETESFGDDFHLDNARIKLGMSLYF